MQIPAELQKDRYWAALLHIFSKHAKLQRFLTTEYINISTRTVKVAALKKIAKPWSESERFMLNLALHLYNEQHKVNLSDMDYLDPNNKAIAFEALRLRFMR